MTLYTLYNKHDNAVVAVVSQSDVADRWVALSPSFNDAMELSHEGKTFKGHKVDDMMAVLNAFERYRSVPAAE